MSKDLVDEIDRRLRQHSHTGSTSRRTFFKVAGSTLILGALSPRLSNAQDADSGRLFASGELNAFIEIGTDGKVRIYSANAEMGQGIKTALPMVIAEEMGVRWEDVVVLQSPVDETTFGTQRAGGSTTVTRTWDQMRQMGASAREMLISAGALVMEVPREELTAAESRVTHTSGRFRTFGQLATLAAQQDLPDPETLIFKERQDYTILGKSVTGVDNLVITTGLALFGIDTQVPGMLFAAYQKCPSIGGEVVRANLDEIRAMPGVVDAFTVKGNGNPRELLDGVAIIGTNTFAVFEAKAKLDIEWDYSNASQDSWTGFVAQANQAHGTRGSEIVTSKGNVDAVFENPDNRVLSAFYEYPFVAHLCMEPMNCTADYRHGTNGAPDSLELWLPTQAPARAYQVTGSIFGLADENVTIHQMRLGGSFGRRVYNEYTCEAIAISKRVRAPVKLTWSREDDVRHDFYRVGGFQSVKGAVDENGRLVGFENHHIGMGKNGRPVTGSGFRANEFPLTNIDNALVTQTLLHCDTPAGPWRAPRSNTNAFVVQSFLDELANMAGRDYRDFLLEIMGEPRWLQEGNLRALNTGRAAGVIRLATDEAGWGRALPPRTGLGLAFYFSHAGHIAEVAEVHVSERNKVTVKNVTVAVDVGPIINRSGATSQVAGSVIDGLSTMAGQKITMENGAIEQSNLHDYPVLRLPQAPNVDVHFIESDYRPTGLGEPALPPLAPAVGNAIYAATGRRVRKMPLIEEGFSI